MLTGQAPLTGVWRTVFTPAERGVAAVSRQFRQSENQTALQAENRELRTQIADLEEKSRQSRAVAEENERLRTLLGLPVRHRNLSLTMANVIGFSGGNMARYFTIDRGERAGINAGMSAIDERRQLAGIVTEASDNQATVRAVTDTHTRIGAVIEQSRTLGVAVGHFDDMKNNTLRMDFLTDDAIVSVGDVVVSSGANEAFPDGLVIGKVSGVRNHESGLGIYARITPAIDHMELRQLFVVTDFANER